MSLPKAWSKTASYGLCVARTSPSYLWPVRYVAGISLNHRSDVEPFSQLDAPWNNVRFVIFLQNVCPQGHSQKPVLEIKPMIRPFNYQSIPSALGICLSGWGGWTLKAVVCTHFGCSTHFCCLLWKAWANAVLWWICPACCHAAAAAAAAEMWTICWLVSSGGGHFHCGLWFNMQITFCCLMCWIMYWELRHSCPVCHSPHRQSIIHESEFC